MAKQRTPNYSFFRLGAVAVVTCSVLGLFISTSWAQTWVEPGISPTSGNVAGPIFNQNVSAQTPTASPFSNFWISGSGTLSTINLKGSASGTVTIQPAATAGTYTLTLPTSGGTNGQVLTTNGASPAVLSWTTVSGGTPAGNTGYVQFNNAGAFGADSGLFWDNTNKRLGIGSSTLNEKLVIGTDLGALAANTGVVLGDGAADSAYYVGQASGSVGAVKWAYNATAANGYLQVTTAGYANQVRIDGSAVVLQTGSGGNVGIRNTAPSAMLTLGTSASSLGTLGLAGNTSGMITIQPAAAAGTFTLVLPSAAPSAGQVLSVSSYAAPTITTGWSTVSAAASGSTGYMQFNNAGALGSDSTLFWDNTNKRLGVGNGAPGQVLTVGASGKLGTLGLAGNTSGVFTIQPAAAAGTFTLVLPSAAPSAGQVLSVSSYAAPTITTGWSTVSAAPAGSTGYVQFNNAGAMGSDSTFFWDNTNKRLGVGNGAPGQVLTVGASGKLGTLGLAGNTSGVFTIQPAAAAGTFTLVLPSAAPSAGQVLSVSSYAAPTITTSWTTVSGGGNMSCGGTCTTSYIPKFSSGTGIINSLIYDTGSYVGVNNTSPAYTLDVNGTIRAGASALLSTGGNAGYYQDATNGAYRSIVASSTTNGYYFQTNAGGATTMYVGLGGTYNGRVGIGTTTPGAQLHIHNGSGFGILRITGTTGYPWDIASAYNYTNADLTFTMNGSEKMRVNNTGTLCVGFGAGGDCQDAGPGLRVAGTVSGKKAGVGGASFYSEGGYYGLYVPSSGTSPLATYGVMSYGTQVGVYGDTTGTGTGVYGYNSSSGNTGPAIEGYNIGNGDGIRGTSNGGVGVYGTSLASGGYGLYTPNSAYVGQKLLVSGWATFNVNTTADPPASASGGLTIGWNKTGGGAEVDFFNIFSSFVPSPTFSWYVYSGGTYFKQLHIGGDSQLYSYGYQPMSDRTLKKNIVDLTDDMGLESVMKLKPVTFEWKNENLQKGQRIGFIAQDMQEVFPQLVSKGLDDKLSINYDGIISPAVKAIQELKTERDNDKEDVDEKIKDLQKQIDELKEKAH